MITRARAWLEDAFTSQQFTYKQLRGMFLTLVLDSFFIMFINALSASMVSSTGEAAIAAVNMVGSVNALVSLLFSALATGGSIVIARAKGRGDESGIRTAIGETICLCGVVALAFGGLLFAFSEVLIGVLYPRAEPLLVEYSIRYMRLMCVSFIPFSVFNVIFYAFRSTGDTRSSLFLTVCINTLHLLCSFLFINGLQLGVTGAGLSYIVARAVGAAVALVWLLKVHNEYHIRVNGLFHFSKDITSQIVQLGVPIASESALFQGGMLLVQIYLAYLTTIDLAAHGVANSVFGLFLSTGNAMTSFTTTVCGQCYGAGQYDLTRRYCRKIIAAGRVVMLAVTVVFLSASPLLLKLYSPTENALPTIWKCLFIGSIGLPIIWCDGYVTPMALRSAGDATFSTVVSVGALAVGRIVIGYLLTIVAGLGVPGVWIGMMCEWLIRAVLMRRRIRGDKWLHIKPAQA